MPSLMVAALVLFLAPVGAAQGPEVLQLTVEVDGHGSPLDPYVPVQIPVRVVVECHPPEAMPSPMPMEVVLAAQTTAKMAQLVLAPERHTVELDTCATEPVVLEATLEVIVDPEAQAFTKIPIKLTASAEGAVDDTHAWEERVGLHMETLARAEQTAWKAGPNARVSVPVRIDNLGNDDIAASFKRGDGTSPHLNVAPPGQVFVRPGESLTVTVELQTPFKNGYLQQEDDLEIIVTAHSVNDPDHVETHDLSVLIETVGTYLPGPAPFLLVLALAGLVAAVRRGTLGKP